MSGRTIIRGREPMLAFAPRLEGTLRREEWRASAMLLAVVGGVLGALVVVSCAFARGFGLLVDARAVTAAPTGEVWVARLGLAVALLSIGAIAAWVLRGLR